MPSAVRVVLVLFLVTGIFGFPTTARGTEKIAQVQAAYVYNFLKYTTWPQTKTPGVLRVCVFQAPEVYQALREARAALVHGNTLEIHDCATIHEFQRADAVFIPATTAPRIPQDAWTAHGAPVLVISDWEHALNHQASIQLNTTASGSLRFAVNLTQARRSGLCLSSKLLRLATEVREDQP